MEDAYPRTESPLPCDVNLCSPLHIRASTAYYTIRETSPTAPSPARSQSTSYPTSESPHHTPQIIPQQLGIRSLNHLARESRPTERADGFSDSINASYQRLIGDRLHPGITAVRGFKMHRLQNRVFFLELCDLCLKICFLAAESFVVLPRVLEEMVEVVCEHV